MEQRCVQVFDGHQTTQVAVICIRAFPPLISEDVLNALRTYEFVHQWVTECGVNKLLWTFASYVNELTRNESLHDTVLFSQVS